MVGTAENVSLKLNEFQNNLKSSYRAVRKTEDFSDMTLVCEDGKQIAAHKMILSSSSTFFRDLLARNPHPHPLVYMRAVQHITLASIVDFIYHGEAEVRKEELESFLELAGELSIKGMTKKDENDTIKEETVSEVSQNEQNILNHHLEKQEEEIFPCEDCDKSYGTKASLRTHKYSHQAHNVQENVKDINRTPKEEQDQVVKESFPCDDCGKMYGTKASLRTHKYKTPGHPWTSLDMSLDMALVRNLDKSLNRSSSILVEEKSPIEKELEERIDAITELREGLWNCIQCGKADKKKFHLRRHAETHVEGFAHTCTICRKIFSQRAGLKYHKVTAHQEDRMEKYCSS